MCELYFNKIYFKRLMIRETGLRILGNYIIFVTFDKCQSTLKQRFTLKKGWKVGVAMLREDDLDFKAKNITTSKGNFTMVKGQLIKKT